MTVTVANKIACIGGGYWGKNLVRNFNDLGYLSWVCEMDPDRRAHLMADYPTARFTESVDQVLADPEVVGVAIATPAETHNEMVRQALLAGKDVFVEKPLCLSVEDGKQLIALASERRRTTLARPCTVPGEAAMPVMTSASRLGSGGMPNIFMSPTPKGSSLGGGGSPMIAAGMTCDHISISDLR